MKPEYLLGKKDLGVLAKPVWFFAVPIFIVLLFFSACSSQPSTERDALLDGNAATDSPAAQTAPEEVPETVLPPADPEPADAEALQTAEPVEIPLEPEPPELLSETPQLTLPPLLPEESIVEVPLVDPPMPQLPEAPELPLPEPPPPPVDEAPATEPPAPAVEEPPLPEEPIQEEPQLPEPAPEPPPFMRLPERQADTAPSLPLEPPRREPQAAPPSTQQPPSDPSIQVEPVLPITPPSRAESNAPPAPAIPPVPVEDQIVISRTVRALAGQLVEIPFRGAGWIYLEEVGSRRGVTYESRRLDPEGHTFVFRAEAPGTYLLKFYRRDNIRDYDMNDYIQVIVEPASSLSNPPESLIDRSRVTAEPRWPETDGASGPARNPAGSPSDQSQPAGTLPDQPQSSGALTDQTALDPDGNLLPDETDLSGGSAAPVINPDEYVNRAKTEYDAGRIAQAISILDELKRLYPDMDDEALWLYGQLMEANSPSRDIRIAMDCYNRLIQEYPQSPRVADAQRRIAYLERYYFNIR